MRSVYIYICMSVYRCQTAAINHRYAYIGEESSCIERIGGEMIAVSFRALVVALLGFLLWLL